MNPVILIGWIAIAAATIVLLTGLHALLGEIVFRARWKWGDARKLKRSVRLGWNTGAPPDGSKFLVLEYISDLKRGTNWRREYGYAVMVRDGDRAYSVCGGMSEPITNITGWLTVSDDDGGA